jgi:hypothetical protein
MVNKELKSAAMTFTFMVMTLAYVWFLCNRDLKHLWVYAVFAGATLLWIWDTIYFASKGGEV